MKPIYFGDKSILDSFIAPTEENVWLSAFCLAVWDQSINRGMCIVTDLDKPVSQDEKAR